MIAPPLGEGFWHSLENRPPLHPHWGAVLRFGDSSPTKTPEPPTPGTKEFDLELEEVERKSSSLSDEQLRQVKFWADGIGSATPVGHWLRIAFDEISETDISFKKQLNAISVISAALFNAGIDCWAAKFRYWTPRPSQLSSRVVVRVKVPNFPAYASGHSTFSWASVEAMSSALEPRRLGKLAHEASESRVLAGLHYTCDCLGGEEIGRVSGKNTAESLMAADSINEAAFGANRGRSVETPSPAKN